MGGGIKLAIEENQMSWNDIEKFARQNNWSHSEIEEYKNATSVENIVQRLERMENSSSIFVLSNWK